MWDELDEPEDICMLLKDEMLVLVECERFGRGEGIPGPRGG